jgi:DNA repair exonuclease SbcCD nuclease subunit
MKILFCADIHIKLNQKNVPVDWARNRYSLFHEKLYRLQKEVDLVIIGGDVFDRLPNMEEIEIYFDLVKVFDRETIIIPGNHESVKKNTTFLTNLKSATNIINRNVTILDDFATIHDIDFIPYNKLKEYNPADIDFHSDILVTHVRAEIPPHVKAEVNLDLFDRWKVVLAGDLHSYENSQRNILYSGSPMSTSFHRNPVRNGVIIFDTNTLQHSWIDLQLPQLLRRTIRAGEPMSPGTYDHVIYEVEGDLAELQSVENNELLDKKVSKRETEVSLILSTEMTLLDELTEYLRYILNMEDVSIRDVIQEYKNMEAKLSVNI